MHFNIELNTELIFYYNFITFKKQFLLKTKTKTRWTTTTRYRNWCRNSRPTHCPEEVKDIIPDFFMESVHISEQIETMGRFDYVTESVTEEGIDSSVLNYLNYLFSNQNC